MREALSALAADSWVLDLGSASGSFQESSTVGRVVRLDLAPIRRGEGRVIRADAARLPFADGAFDAVVANHSFEHFEELELVLGELGRVIKPTGAIFVSVPDASTVTDRLYRWLARGGGHVNAFTDPMQLAGMIVRATGMRLSGMKVLHSGLSFLNRKNIQRVPRRLFLFGGGFEWTLQIGTYALRLMDLVFGSRYSVYGWAYYFGAVAALDLAPASNVCVRCGAGHGAEWLRATSRIYHFPLWNYYHCPSCQTTNLFLDEPARTME
ncbi:MAG: class I SAM-dependent methyltransferase [Bryobacteraceae bacterium]